MSKPDFKLRCAFKPIVRYVDQDQAVIEIDVSLESALNLSEAPTDEAPLCAKMVVEIHDQNGFSDEYEWLVPLDNGRASAKFDMVHPHRWWPAGMGGQTLYEMTVTLSVSRKLSWTRRHTLGLTSVRQNTTDGMETLLVNGRCCDIKSIVSVDRRDENRMLPATGDSLLVVRDHYGTDVLYDAADRAGILLLQCVPIHPQGQPETDVADAVDRLSSHPSLAGWYVGHLGDVRQRLTQCLHTLDPAHSVFEHVPGLDAA